MSDDMRFHVIRTQTDEGGGHYELDGKRCPVCYKPTEILPGSPERRYCCNKKCSAMVLEEAA